LTLNSETKYRPVQWHRPTLHKHYTMVYNGIGLLTNRDLHKHYTMVSFCSYLFIYLFEKDKGPESATNMP